VQVAEVLIPVIPEYFPASHLEHVAEELMPDPVEYVPVLQLCESTDVYEIPLNLYMEYTSSLVRALV
jgi:hypothetical protein